MCYNIKHHRDLKSKGYGFVCFVKKDDKMKAIAAKTVYFEGRPIFIDNYYQKSAVKSDVNAAEIYSNGMTETAEHNEEESILRRNSSQANSVKTKSKGQAPAQPAATKLEGEEDESGIRIGVLRPPPTFVLNFSTRDSRTTFKKGYSLF